MPGKNYVSALGPYRTGYQGQEKIDEIYGTGNYIDFEYRGYDTRVGRFWSTDPLEESYPMYSPYHFSSNQPIHAPELEGKESSNDLNFKDQSFQALDKEGQETVRDIQGQVGLGVLGAFASELAIAKAAGYAYNIYKAYRAEKAVQTVVKAEKIIEKVKSAYDIAKEGGKHSGLIKNYAGKTIKEIEKGIEKLGKRVEEHLSYVKDPAKALADKQAKTGKGKLWDEMGKQEQEGILKFWKKEADNYQEQKEVLEGIAKEIK